MFIYSFIWKSESLSLLCAVLRLFEAGCFIKKERKRFTQSSQRFKHTPGVDFWRDSQWIALCTKMCERGKSEGARMGRETERAKGQALRSSLITWSCGTNWSPGRRGPSWGASINAFPTVFTVDKLKISMSFQHHTGGQASSQCVSGFRETYPTIIQAMLLGWVSRLWLRCSS